MHNHNCSSPRHITVSYTNSFAKSDVCNSGLVPVNCVSVLERGNDSRNSILFFVVVSKTK
jgi:hypothetical protein